MVPIWFAVLCTLFVEIGISLIRWQMEFSIRGAGFGAFLLARLVYWPVMAGSVYILMRAYDKKTSVNRFK